MRDDMETVVQVLVFCNQGQLGGLCMDSAPLSRAQTADLLALRAASIATSC